MVHLVVQQNLRFSKSTLVSCEGELESYEPMTPDTVLSASQDHGLL